MITFSQNNGLNLNDIEWVENFPTLRDFRQIITFLLTRGPKIDFRKKYMSLSFQFHWDKQNKPNIITIWPQIRKLVFLPVLPPAAIFNVKNRHYPCISQRVIGAHFFHYDLKYSNQVRNLAGQNLVTGFKEFTQLLIGWRDNTCA